MNTLFIAEKPSAAKAIADGIGNGVRMDTTSVRMVSRLATASVIC